MSETKFANEANIRQIFTGVSSQRYFQRFHGDSHSSFPHRAFHGRGSSMAPDSLKSSKLTLRDSSHSSIPLFDPLLPPPSLSPRPHLIPQIVVTNAHVALMVPASLRVPSKLYKPACGVRSVPLIPYRTTFLFFWVFFSLYLSPSVNPFARVLSITRSLSTSVGRYRTNLTLFYFLHFYMHIYF